VIKRHYINSDMTALKTALESTEFLTNMGSTVSIDINWSEITTKMPTASPYYYNSISDLPETGDEHSVYFVKEATNAYRLYTYDAMYSYQQTPTVVSSPANVDIMQSATIDVKDEDGNVVFRIAKDVYTYIWTTYASSSVYASGSLGNSTYGSSIPYMYSCKNGIMIVMTVQNINLIIRMVATNLGKLAVISRRNTGASIGSNINGYKNAIDCIARGDVAPLSTIDIPNRYDTHYEVVPMFTNSDAVSYTDKSGFLLYSPGDFAIKGINVAGKKYLSDSYFAIEDE
jgi:hypothetical protein